MIHIQMVIVIVDEWRSYEYAQSCNKQKLWFYIAVGESCVDFRLEQNAKSHQFHINIYQFSSGDRQHNKKQCQFLLGSRATPIEVVILCCLATRVRCASRIQASNRTLWMSHNCHPYNFVLFRKNWKMRKARLSLRISSHISSSVCIMH